MRPDRARSLADPARPFQNEVLVGRSQVLGLSDRYLADVAEHYLPGPATTQSAPWEGPRGVRGGGCLRALGLAERAGLLGVAAVATALEDTGGDHRAAAVLHDGRSTVMAPSSVRFILAFSDA